MSTPSVEDYLKAIYKARTNAEDVTSQDIAARVGVSGAAVSKMLRRLTELRLAEHTPYHGVRLTKAGEKIALEIIRHHRLLERYLVEALGYSWDQVHVEAERLEHHISEEFEARIDALLGYPATCPHGDPIPARDGSVPAIRGTALSSQSDAATLVVERVGDTDAKLLRYFDGLGLRPGAVIEFVEREPFGGAFLVRFAGTLVRVAPEAADQLFVGACGNLRAGSEEPCSTSGVERRVVE